MLQLLYFWHMFPVKDITIGYKHLALKETGLLKESIELMGERRYKICQACPDKQFNEQSKRCMLCECKMEAKTLVPGAYCPAGHWEKEL